MVHIDFLSIDTSVNLSVPVSLWTSGEIIKRGSRGALEEIFAPQEVNPAMSGKKKIDLRTTTEQRFTFHYAQFIWHSCGQKGLITGQCQRWKVRGQLQGNTHKTFLHVKDIPAVPLLLLPLQLFLLFHAVWKADVQLLTVLFSWSRAIKQPLRRRTETKPARMPGLCVAYNYRTAANLDLRVLIDYYFTMWQFEVCQ